MKIVTAKVVRLDENSEALRFAIDEKELDVALTSQDGINGLRVVYEALLEEVIKDDVTVELSDKDDDATAMYQDVCREYIELLKSDLASARQEIVNKGLAAQSEDKPE